jgi:threonine dehydrogenase-like Zn-dependent dehydrogenase
MKPLLGLIERGAIDPSFVVSHRLPLEEGPAAYAMFLDKTDGCTKVVLRP